VALKLIRNNDTMRKAAEKELSILTQITKTDPDGRKHCVHILDHAEFRNHVIFIFESMSMNLRDALKRFGKGVGINIAAVRLYAKQLFIALKHIGDQRIVHADIKLDNILVSEDLKQVIILSVLFDKRRTCECRKVKCVSLYRSRFVILALRSVKLTRIIP